MKQYICIKGFAVDKYDDNGFSTNEYNYINKNDVFQLSDSNYRIIGGYESIRLDNSNIWLEINKETLENYFREVINE